MKIKLFLIMLLCLFAIKGKSQYAIAGQPGELYTDIIPDTTIQVSGVFPNFNSYGFFDVSMNTEFDMYVYVTSTSAQNSTTSFVQLASAITNNMKFGLGNIDSSWSNQGSGYWITRNILKKYDLGDTITEATFVGVNSGNIAYNYSYSSPFLSETFSSDQWLNPVGEGYVAIKYMDSIGVRFGWIRIEALTFKSCLLKEFSLSSLNPVNLKASDSGPKFLVYPNPATDKICIGKGSEVKKIDELILIDVYGVQHEALMNDKNEIDVSQLNPGVYFLQIKTSEGVGVKKIVVQR